MPFVFSITYSIPSTEKVLLYLLYLEAYGMRLFTSQGNTKSTEGKANESDEYNEHTKGKNLISRVCVTVEEIWGAF